MSLSEKAVQIAQEKDFTGCIIIGVKQSETFCDFHFAASKLDNEKIYEVLCEAVYFFIDDLKNKGVIKIPGSNGS